MSWQISWRNRRRCIGYFGGEYVGGIVYDYSCDYVCEIIFMLFYIMKENYRKLYFLLPLITNKSTVMNYERRTRDIIILGMGSDTVIYNIVNGFYTDTRYNEDATNQLMNDIQNMDNISRNANVIIKGFSPNNRNYFDRACSLCNNDAEYKYMNGLFICCVCHSSFLTGFYGKADIGYYYSGRNNLTRKDGIYFINDERIKIIYSYGEGLFEHITVRKDVLYSKYSMRIPRNNIYCDICAVNKRSGDCGKKLLCEICAKILKDYNWKKVLPFVVVILYMLDDRCSVKLCCDVKRYCLLFV